MTANCAPWMGAGDTQVGRRGFLVARTSRLGLFASSGVKLQKTWGGSILPSLEPASKDAELHNMPEFNKTPQTDKVFPFASCLIKLPNAVCDGSTNSCV